MGFVYILKNPSFGDEWVKIGKTDNDDIKERVNQLNRTEATPFAFRIYAIYEVENPLMVEQQIHGLFDEIHYGLRARESLNGRIRVREFFHITPEKAYRIFERIAILRNDKSMLKLYAPNDEQIAEEEQAETLSHRRSRTTFEMLKINPCTELKFFYNDTYTCRTSDKKSKVMYNNKKVSLSTVALKIGKEILDWNGSSVNGFKYFTFEGETLWDRRIRMENEEMEENEGSEDTETLE